MKTNKQMIRLLGVGGVFLILSRIVAGTAKDWFADISMLAFAAGMVVFLVGMVSARRALETKGQGRADLAVRVDVHLTAASHQTQFMTNILAVAGPGSKYQIPGARPAGFWAGLWHGIISPITFIVSLFTPRVRIYETHNCGRFYDFGFIIGIAGAFGGSGQQTGRHLST